MLRLVEDLLQRLAAFGMTAVWFAWPLGALVAPWPTAPVEHEVDASRLAAAVDRVITWDLGEPDARPADEATAQGELPEAAPRRVEPRPAPVAPTLGDDTGVGEAADGLADAAEDGGDAGIDGRIDPYVARRRVGGIGTGTAAVVARTGMMRPGAERGEADGTRADKTKPRRGCEETVNPKVEKTGEAAWRVERSLIEEYASDHQKLFSLAWVQKHDDARGRPDGFEVRGIRCGSLLDQVGLRNRDVVHTVNGKKVNNVLQAIAAYRKIRRHERVELEITRGGQTTHLVYEIVD
jgi:hypothetical protein